MRLTPRLFGQLLFAAVLLISSLMGCSEPLPATGEFSCPCVDGWDCIVDTCRRPCTTDADCTDGLSCKLGSYGQHCIQSGASGIWLFSGDTCYLEEITSCGKTSAGNLAVLLCIPSGLSGGLAWSEKELCDESESCSDKKCVPDCDSAWLCQGKECGDDGCGGSCGSCAADKSCLSSMCKDVVCASDCGGAECGPDGCGNTCGECSGAAVCMPPAYVCMDPPSDCKPDCLNKACGPNGCGGSCGTCTDGTFCVAATQTCESPCMPDCTGKDCGDDGCDGSCGGCAEADEFCLPDDTCGPCDPVLNVYCPPEHYCTYVGNEGPSCEPAGTQHYGEYCGGLDECSEGICSALYEGEPLCYQMCKTNSDCGEQSCIELQGAPYKVCEMAAEAGETCNLLAQDCSLPSQGCYFSAPAGEPVCMVAGSGQEGEPCGGEPNDCAEGLLCISVNSTWTCRRFCNTKSGQEPLCEDPDYPQCKNYYAKQQAGYCAEDE